jgi:cyclase
MPRQMIAKNIAALVALTCMVGARAQMPKPEDVEVQVIPLESNLHMLMGIGGNIALLTGPDGTFMVDDDLKPMADKIKAAIATISDQPVTILLNTHWHFDHSGGNELFGADGAVIVAHDNVRARMSTEQYSRFFNTTRPPSPDVALPVMTYDSTATFHLNGEVARAVHMPPAHTDGDSIVFFSNANVVHLGDVFFNGMYPFIDIDGGGSIEGIIAAVDEILPMLQQDTRIIPGHGPLGTVEDLQAYRAMLALVTARIRLLIDEGKTEEEVVALQPTVNFDRDWAWQFLPPDRWVAVVYASLLESSGPPATPAE